MRALILVDIQNDFLPSGTLPVPRGDEVIASANLLMPHFDLVVATQDWHGPRHGSFASSHAGRKAGDRIELNGLPQILWPDHCVRRTSGANLAPGLNIFGIDRVFRKGTRDDVDSYSGFFDNARRSSTGLGEYLRHRGVHEVYVCGLATDYCVKATAVDAVGLGFRTFLVEDASRGVDLRSGDVARAVAEMARTGVNVIRSTDVLETARGCVA